MHKFNSYATLANRKTQNKTFIYLCILMVVKISSESSKSVRLIMTHLHMQWYESCALTLVCDSKLWITSLYKQNCLDEGYTYLKLYLLYSLVHMMQQTKKYQIKISISACLFTQGLHPYREGRSDLLPLEFLGLRSHSRQCLVGTFQSSARNSVLSWELSSHSMIQVAFTYVCSVVLIPLHAKL